MKKVFILFLLAMIVVLFAFGCGQKEEPKTETPVEEPAKEMMEDTTMVEDSTMMMEEPTEEMEGTAEEGN